LPVERQLEMVQVNVSALTHLTTRGSFELFGDGHCFVTISTTRGSPSLPTRGPGESGYIDFSACGAVD
jgi:hypothetical protein